MVPKGGIFLTDSLYLLSRLKTFRRQLLVEIDFAWTICVTPLKSSRTLNKPIHLPGRCVVQDSPPEEIQKPLKSTNLVECGVSEWDNEYVNIEQEAGHIFFFLKKYWFLMFSCFFWGGIGSWCFFLANIFSDLTGREQQNDPWGCLKHLKGTFFDC